MISLRLAQQLKEFGLIWRPELHDFFAIPGRGMDERIFVISDIQTYLELFEGHPVVTFHGVAEWALDYIQQTEVVWMPTESQLHARLAELVERYEVVFDPAGYTCTLNPHHPEPYTATATTSSEACGEALLHLLMLQTTHHPPPTTQN